MSFSTNGPDADWEVTPDGLYIATRHFLLRRGYCCANRCRNCPYVNWRAQPTWQHAPAAAIQRTRVSPKVLAGARTALTIHQQALATNAEHDRAYHQEMVEHYERLLASWW